VRGSIALEFLLVLVAITAYAGVVLTAANTLATNSAQDLSKMAKARVAMDKIYNAVQFVSAGSDGSSATVVFYLPPDVNIYLSGNQIKAVIHTDGNFASATPYCSAHECNFVIPGLPLSFDASYEFNMGGTYQSIVISRSGSKVKVS
jgi:uncharacterized protein (UPF0333 family)